MSHIFTVNDRGLPSAWWAKREECSARSVKDRGDVERSKGRWGRRTDCTDFAQLQKLRPLKYPRRMTLLWLTASVLYPVHCIWMFSPVWTSNKTDFFHYLKTKHNFLACSHCHKMFVWLICDLAEAAPAQVDGQLSVSWGRRIHFKSHFLSNWKEQTTQIRAHTGYRNLDMMFTCTIRNKPEYLIIPIFAGAFSSL